ncbi:hypothetical protein OIU77_005581 [Salix suchowensis]|uniref:Secreted protein n=1 Tax=Salix suchowensis TaxID=1278906 RepID=A0ABQ9AR97_9ROSI|nr:hypothetical protein OIU77_005581 [Salix suchowensis]
MWRSMPESPSSSWLVGFHCSTRGPRTLTAWPISGLWCGSRAVQCPASSATLKMLTKVSSSGFRVWSIAFGRLSLLTRTRRNHVTK